LVLNCEGDNVIVKEMSPNLPLARRASSHLILQNAMDQASSLKPP
jgi:hypothetical protein